MQKFEMISTPFPWLDQRWSDIVSAFGPLRMIEISVGGLALALLEDDLELLARGEGSLQSVLMNGEVEPGSLEGTVMKELELEIVTASAQSLPSLRRVRFMHGWDVDLSVARDFGDACLWRLEGGQWFRRRR